MRNSSVFYILFLKGNQAYVVHKHLIFWIGKSRIVFYAFFFSLNSSLGISCPFACIIFSFSSWVHLLIIYCATFCSPSLQLPLQSSTMQNLSPRVALLSGLSAASNSYWLVTLPLHLTSTCLEDKCFLLLFCCFVFNSGSWFVLFMGT